MRVDEKFTKKNKWGIDEPIGGFKKHRHNRKSLREEKRNGFNELEHVAVLGGEYD